MAGLTCLLNERQLIDEFFIENRTKILDIAAFLDRLDRASGKNDTADFRIEAFKKALGVLSGANDSRVLQVQMIFSDPTSEPLPKLDQKSAKGAWDPRAAEVR